MGTCVRHYDEPMEAECRSCHQPFCSRCLVYSFGPKKPPFCVGCALTASGVRNTKVHAAASPPPEPGPDRKALRAERKAAKAAERAKRRAAKQGDPTTSDDDGRDSSVPVPHGVAARTSRYGPP